MKKRRSRYLGLGLLLAGYTFALFWVFTRSTPVISSRPEIGRAHV